MFRRKTKADSLQFSFISEGINFVVMGLLTIGVTIVMQIVAFSDPSTITVTVNDVSREATPGEALAFRLIFLLVFGLIGLASLILGIVCIRHTRNRRKTALHLKDEGIRITATVTNYLPSMIYIERGFSFTGSGFTFGWGIGISSSRGQYWSARRQRRRGHLVRLHCQYEDLNGVSHEFISDYLREEPKLPEGKVTVYRNKTDFSHYFVDVDESAITT